MSYFDKEYSLLETFFKEKILKTIIPGQRIFYKNIKVDTRFILNENNLTEDEIKHIFPLCECIFIDQSKKIKASIKMKYEKQSGQCEWFLSQERTSYFYDPHMDVYMFFEKI